MSTSKKPPPEPCPTPQKVKYRNERNARDMAVRMTRQGNAERRLVAPLYWYDCRCGSVHMTRQGYWSTSKPLYSVPEELQRWAFPPSEPASS